MSSDPVSTKPLLDKLGVKPGHRVSVIGDFDAGFLRLIASRGADVSTRRARASSDAIFLAVETRRDLARIPTLRRFLKPEGALWTVRRKGVKAITEAETMAAGLAAGLVDTKVVSFSATHTAERFVIRLKDRPGH